MIVNRVLALGGDPGRERPARGADVRRWRRRLPPARAVRERGAGRQGRHRHHRGQAGRHGHQAQPHRRRHRRAGAEDRRRLGAAARRHARADSPVRAVGAGEPLHRASAAGRRDPRPSRRRRPASRGPDHFERGSRRGVRDLRPEDAARAARRLPWLGAAVRRAGEERRGRLALPRPVARLRHAAVRRAEPRQRRASPLPRQDVGARRRRRGEARGPGGPRGQPRRHDRRDHAARGPARRGDPPAAPVPAPGEHDLRQPARRAGRHRPARRDGEARREGAPALHARAARLRHRPPPDRRRPRPVLRRPGQVERRGRADARHAAAAQDRGRPGGPQRRRARGRAACSGGGARERDSAHRVRTAVLGRLHRLAGRLLALGQRRRDGRFRPDRDARERVLDQARRALTARTRLARAACSADLLEVGQYNRCPGSVERDRGDGSIPWRPSDDFNCDPTQLPVGP